MRLRRWSCCFKAMYTCGKHHEEKLIVFRGWQATVRPFAGNKITRREESDTKVISLRKHVLPCTESDLPMYGHLSFASEYKGQISYFPARSGMTKLLDGRFSKLFRADVGATNPGRHNTTFLSTKSTGTIWLITSLFPPHRESSYWQRDRLTSTEDLVHRQLNNPLRLGMSIWTLRKEWRPGIEIKRYPMVPAGHQVNVPMDRIDTFTAHGQLHTVLSLGQLQWVIQSYFLPHQPSLHDACHPNG